MPLGLFSNSTPQDKRNPRSWRQLQRLNPPATLSFGPDRRIKTLKMQRKSACLSLSLEMRPCALWGQATVTSREVHHCCSRTCREQHRERAWGALLCLRASSARPQWGLLRPLPLSDGPHTFIKMFAIVNRKDRFYRENKGKPQ